MSNIPASSVVGTCRLYLCTHNAVGLLATQLNSHLYEWGHIVARTLAGDRSYRINAMYVEYENVASPGDTVSIPTFDRAGGVDYYQTSLESSPTRDFLRVPLIAVPEISIEDGFEDYFEAEVSGNKLTVFAQTQGSSGFHGRAFNDVSNSKVCGAALVSARDWQDPSQDRVFARAYYDVAAQAVKSASSQFGVSWEVAFK